MTVSSTADYDQVAAFYRKHWCNHYHGWALEVFRRVLLAEVKPGARILDVCCGAGTMAAALIAEGFDVTGLDCSAGMLREARQVAPDAEFIHADVRDFQLESKFDAALCTFDSLNHLLTYPELVSALRNVARTLEPGGRFAFDVNLEEAYRRWDQSCCVVEEETACFVRGGFDPAERLGRTEITLFERNGSWRRSDTFLLQRCYTVEELTAAMSEAGLSDGRVLDAAKDLGVEGYFGQGRGICTGTRVASSAYRRGETTVQTSSTYNSGDTTVQMSAAIASGSRAPSTSLKRCGSSEPICR